MAVEFEGDRRLEWVQRNRDRRVSRRMPVSAGEVARELLASGRIAPGGWRGEVAAALEDCLGSGARGVEIGRLSRGVLTLLVADASRACALRLRWADSLADLLRRRVPEAGIRSVSFRVRSRGRRPAAEG